MIAPDSAKISITDIAYRDGYRDAEKDLIKRVTQRLWEYEAQIKLAYPEIACGIRDAIAEIEKISEY
jgi:predicted DNA-binding protein YlxM (UPF0122 family)